MGEIFATELPVEVYARLERFVRSSMPYWIPQSHMSAFEQLLSEVMDLAERQGVELRRLSNAPQTADGMLAARLNQVERERDAGSQRIQDLSRDLSRLLQQTHDAQQERDVLKKNLSMEEALSEQQFGVIKYLRALKEKP